MIGAPAAKPLVSFMIGGAQKCGTSALAEYLRQHPEIDLPARKEAHVFDGPRFDESSTIASINALFSRHYRKSPPPRLLGDATPITLMYPRAIERVARYNADMRWILLFRDPVMRTVSHYAMQRSRGFETLPLLMATLAESRRLRGRRDGTSSDLEFRRYSYVLRSRYADQLDALFRHFSRDKILLLRSEDLQSNPAAVVAQACAFIGATEAPPDNTYPPVFKGSYSAPSRWSPGMLLLRWRLRHEVRELSERHGFDLRHQGRRHQVDCNDF